MRAIAQTMWLADIWICCKLIGARWMVLLDTNIQLFFFYCSYSLVGTVSFDMTGQNSNSVSQLASCYIVSPSWWELCIMFLNSHYVPVSKFTQTVTTYQDVLVLYLGDGWAYAVESSYITMAVVARKKSGPGRREEAINFRAGVCHYGTVWWVSENRKQRAFDSE